MPLPSNADFELLITELTRPFNNQLPRPWMTDLKDPLEASVFIVGRNQAKTYSADRLDHTRHINGLFNRQGETARGIYDEMTDGKRSPTRANTDMLRNVLRRAKVEHVLETNVVCYSTKMSSGLRSAEHRGGRDKGTKIFQSLLRFIRPKVLIAHGAGTRSELSRLLGKDLPEVPIVPGPPEVVTIGEMHIFIIPSLAPPGWNRWCQWSDTYLAQVAACVQRLV